MTALRWCLALVCAVLSAGPGAAPGVPGAGDPAPPGPCVESWPEVRPNARRYDHYVHLRNRCGDPARCTVASDSNPAPTHVVVDPWKTLEVLVARAAPEPSLVPRVTCRYRPKAHPERSRSDALAEPLLR